MPAYKTMIDSAFDSDFGVLMDYALVDEIKVVKAMPAT